MSNYVKDPRNNWTREETKPTFMDYFAKFGAVLILAFCIGYIVNYCFGDKKNTENVTEKTAMVSKTNFTVGFCTSDEIIGHMDIFIVFKEPRIISKKDTMNAKLAVIDIVMLQELNMLLTGSVKHDIVKQMSKMFDDALNVIITDVRLKDVSAPGYFDSEVKALTSDNLAVDVKITIKLSKICKTSSYDAELKNIVREYVLKHEALEVQGSDFKQELARHLKKKTGENILMCNINSRVFK